MTSLFAHGEKTENKFNYYRDQRSSGGSNHLSDLQSVFSLLFFQAWFRIDKDFKSKSISENFD
jgi:hypothetical protein